MLFLLGLTTSSINHEKAFILISFIRLFICNHCTEYDLCISRNDRHSKGTSESPYGTIEEALKQGLNTTGNDTVHIRIQSGFYPLNQTLRIDKSPSVPVVIEGEGKDKPVISGGNNSHFLGENSRRMVENASSMKLPVMD